MRCGAERRRLAAALPAAHASCVASVVSLICDAEFTLSVYHLLQLRVGNVIEHNGKLLQVVSLQNRAMGVSRAAGHAAALFAAGPLLAQRRFGGRS